MENFLFQNLKDISWAVVVVVFLLISRPIFEAVARLLDKKLNGSVPAGDVFKQLNLISNHNHHEITDILREIKDGIERIERKIDGISEGMAIVKDRTKDL